MNNHRNIFRHKARDYGNEQKNEEVFIVLTMIV